MHFGSKKTPLERGALLLSKQSIKTKYVGCRVMANLYRVTVGIDQLQADLYN
jgi:hypothetical protein